MKSLVSEKLQKFDRFQSSAAGWKAQLQSVWMAEEERSRLPGGEGTQAAHQGVALSNTQSRRCHTSSATDSPVRNSVTRERGKHQICKLESPRSYCSCTAQFEQHDLLRWRTLPTAAPTSLRPSPAGPNAPTTRCPSGTSMPEPAGHPPGIGRASAGHARSQPCPYTPDPRAGAQLGQGHLRFAEVACAEKLDSFHATHETMRWR